MPIIGEIIAMDRRGLLTLPDSALDKLPAEYRKGAGSRIQAAPKKVRDEAKKSKDCLFD